MFRYLWTQTHSKAHAFIDQRIPFHIVSLFHCKQQSFYNPTLDIYLQRLANIDEKNAILGNSNSVTQITKVPRWSFIGWQSVPVLIFTFFHFGRAQGIKQENPWHH